MNKLSQQQVETPEGTPLLLTLASPCSIITTVRLLDYPCSLHLITKSSYMKFRPPASLHWQVFQIKRLSWPAGSSPLWGRVPTHTDDSILSEVGGFSAGSESVSSRERFASCTQILSQPSCVSELSEENKLLSGCYRPLPHLSGKGAPAPACKQHSLQETPHAYEQATLNRTITTRI